MFDIGFPELLLISVVALVVIGPEKLPETVRTIALWIGRFKRSLSNIRMELENEIGADEIRQQLHNENIMKELSDTKSELEDIIQNADNSISDATNSLKSIPADLSAVSIEDEINDALEDPTGLEQIDSKTPADVDTETATTQAEVTLAPDSNELEPAPIPGSKQDTDAETKLTGSGSQA